MQKTNIDLADQVGAYPTCGGCGAQQVVRDAWAEWNQLTAAWELKAVFDNFACDACGETIAPVWQIDKDFRTRRIRRLNDALRQGKAEFASVLLTEGVRALGDSQIPQIVRAVAEYEDFTPENDPHGEHDFGAFDIADEQLFFKIDYFDRRMKTHSPDAANPAVTHRVLTIMLAREY